MISSTYHHSLSAAVARERVNDMLREAEAARVAAQVPARTRHRTPRRRPAWWLRVTTRRATLRTA